MQSKAPPYLKVNNLVTQSFLYTLLQGSGSAQRYLGPIWGATY